MSTFPAAGPWMPAAEVPFNETMLCRLKDGTPFLAFRDKEFGWVHDLHDPKLEPEECALLNLAPNTELPSTGLNADDLLMINYRSGSMKKWNPALYSAISRLLEDANRSAESLRRSLGSSDE